MLAAAQGMGGGGGAPQQVRVVFVESRVVAMVLANAKVRLPCLESDGIKELREAVS